MARYDPRFLPPAGSGYFGAAAAPAVVQNQRQIADMLGSGTPGATYNLGYYDNLRRQGYTVDPYTGIPLPETGTGTGRRSSVGSSSGVDQSEVQPSGPADLINPFAFPATTGGDKKVIEEQQKENARKQEGTRFSDVRQQFRDMLLGEVVREANAPVTPDGYAEAAQREFSTALHPHMRERSRQAAADYIALTKAASNPRSSSYAVQDLTRQFQEKYPEFAGLDVRPQSREQIAALEEEQAVEKIRDSFEAMGFPREFVLGRDEKGEAKTVMPVGDMMRLLSENQRADRESARSEREYADKKYREKRKELEDHLKNPPKPDLAAGELTASNGLQAAWRVQREVLEKETDDWAMAATGYRPRAMAEASIPQETPTTPARQAAAEGVGFVQPKSVDDIRAGLGKWPAGTIVQYSDGRVFRVNGRGKLTPMTPRNR